MAENLAITFDNWIITPPDGIIARQYDNLSRDLVVTGTFPDGYLWEMLIWCKGNYNTLAMTQSEGQLSTTLTDEDLAFDGYYKMQLRGTIGEEVRHTNVICVKIPCSIDGDVNWPAIPSIYREYLKQVQQLVQDAQTYAGNAETDATTATQAAQMATGAATQAQGYAQTAETASTDAQDAASTAQSAESDAQQHADNAQASADQAAQSAAETADKIPLSQKGAAGGVATLDDNSLVPTAQIPIIPVTKGGTGSDDYNEGRINIGAASNPNLLDNWYFVGGGSQQGGGQFPINQRGQTTITPGGFGIDRWTLDSQSTSTILADGIEVSSAANNRSAMVQRVPADAFVKGQTYTLSFFVKNISGTIKSLVSSPTGSINSYGDTASSGIHIISTIFSVPSDFEDDFINAVFRVTSAGGGTVIAAKLELGPVQTLAHQDADGTWVLNDPPPNFQQELAKCQRYFVRYSYGGSNTVGIIARSAAWDRLPLPIPVPMRTKPSVSLSTETFLNVIDTRTSLPTPTIVDIPTPGTSLALGFTHTGDSLDATYVYTSVSGYIDFNADL